jgi:hypothetical protein
MTPARTTTTTDRPSPAACGRPIVYWHHQLPPFDAELLGEHILDDRPRSGSSVFRGVTDFVMSPSYHSGTTSR